MGNSRFWTFEFEPNGRHHVPVARWCDLCHNSEESTYHALIHCPAVKRFWKTNGTRRTLKTFNQMAAQDLCFWLMDHTSRTELEEFCCRAWLIWSKRCRAVHNNENIDLRGRVVNGTCMLEEYRDAKREKLTTRPLAAVISPTKWQAPQEGQLGLDVDACLPENSYLCGLGGVIRIHEGHMMAALGRSIPKPVSLVLG
ncbi:uncharacterized protein [Primulina huaijiensis]|uniref:uncharacterized protein n=1 Tax=Primulina huaijiensis TaxID=1492673 RepID=UPI003CC6F218